MQIDLKVLQRAIDITLKDLELSYGTSVVEVSDELYWEIPAQARYNVQEDPCAKGEKGLCIGQLSEDYEFLELTVAGDEPIPRALKWAANILLRLGELNPLPVDQPPPQEELAESDGA